MSDWESIYHHFRKNGIRHLLHDSRQCLSPKESAFFAMRTDKGDGHLFVLDLYAKGLRCFIVEKQMDRHDCPDAVFFKVRNSVEALQGIAQLHRERMDCPVVGITGSNGKTIVKEWLYQLLWKEKNIVRSPQSFNSQIGVPLSVWRMDTQHNLAIFEAGVSRKGEMERIAPVIRCSTGIFTSLGTAHDAGFSHKKEKALEKARLFQWAKKIIFPYDDEVVREVVARQAAKGRSWSWQSKEADLFILKNEPGAGQEITALYQGQQIHIHIPFTDAVSAENAIICWLMLLDMGYPNGWINERMQSLEPVAMRLEVKKGIRQSRIINDTYNLDLTSLRSSLAFMGQQSGTMPQALILSDILEHQTPVEILYPLIAGWLGQYPQLDVVVGIGRDIPLLGEFLGKRVQSHFYTDTDGFLQHFPVHILQGHSILVKGARVFRFERIITRLEQKTHRTILEIQLNALEDNFRVYQNLLGKKTRTMAMVKAAAYGAGLVEVAQLLESKGVDELAVAYTDEGVALREAGIRCPILVLNPENTPADVLSRHQLEPEVYSLAQLQSLSASQAPGTTLPIHIKLDTGMKRLGFEPQDMPALIAEWQGLQKREVGPSLVIRSVFSHLVASDDAQHDGFTQRQIQAFEEMYHSLSQALDIRPMRHILNTAGISRFPDCHWEMVRLGIGLYGLDDSPSVRGLLQPVGTLKARISQIKHLQAGQTVGYNRNGQSSIATRIATLSIGYADGLPRAAGNGRYAVRIRGRMAPTIGHVCMDMCMVDIGHIPDAQVGDEAIIFGHEPSIRDLAQCLGTIPYEVIASVSDRVKRVYVWD